MKFETFKSLVLIGLVGLSLLLTFSVWNYQPEYPTSQNTDPAYIPEIDAGGEVETKRGVVIPTRGIFHIEEEYYGFDQPSKLMDLYKNVQHWSLAEYVERADEEIDLAKPYFEMVYPEMFPIEMVKSLFTLADDIELPNWNFERVLIALEEEHEAIRIYFPSHDERHHIRFTVYEEEAYAMIADILQERDHLVEYIMHHEGHTPLYLPKDPTELSYRTIAVDRIEPPIFVDALFQNPSIVVTPNFGESYFIDGQRDMRVTENGHRLEFINPLQNTTDRMSLVEILEQSLASINDHKGWTADFHVQTIDKSNNRIVYQMHYEGYPVYHEGGLTIIEQQWRNQYLYKYNRPLFRLLSPFSGGLVLLPTGNEVIYFLEHISNYEIEKVSDIQIGYFVADIDEESRSIRLEPAWFMLYNDRWQQIRMDDLESYNEGGF